MFHACVRQLPFVLPAAAGERQLPFVSPARRAVLRGQRQRDLSLWTPFLRCGGEWVRQSSFLRIAPSAKRTAGGVGE